MPKLIYFSNPILFTGVRYFYSTIILAGLHLVQIFIHHSLHNILQWVTSDIRDLFFEISRNNPYGWHLTAYVEFSRLGFISFFTWANSLIDGLILITEKKNVVNTFGSYVSLNYNTLKTSTLGDQTVLKGVSCDGHFQHSWAGRRRQNSWQQLLEFPLQGFKHFPCWGT